MALCQHVSPEYTNTIKSFSRLFLLYVDPLSFFLICGYFTVLFSYWGFPLISALEIEP